MRTDFEVLATKSQYYVIVVYHYVERLGTIQHTYESVVDVYNADTMSLTENFAHVIGWDETNVLVPTAHEGRGE